ncbi:hypothetical protein [Undibacterium sp. TS12]|uniref:hypothetical protein n=1 Tax=Undibacterium sp. TS12 TaxID=2908202 RepID=UPI001F4CD992|nr:hypothetical protein [Undibacterium sp. TS12]MCH8622630.1 hypothetical protein [Undibacterium sp. TS12]
MGLLNIFSDQDDPQSQAQMAAAMALLQAGGPSRTPVSLGQALGGAMQSYQNTLQAAKDRQLQQSVLRNRLAFDNGRMPGAVTRDYPFQLGNQQVALLSAQNNTDPSRRALQADPEKPSFDGRKYFFDWRTRPYDFVAGSGADGEISDGYSR